MFFSGTNVALLLIIVRFLVLGAEVEYRCALAYTAENVEGSNYLNNGRLS